MKILVTGAAGFIGSHLSDYFVAQGHDVVGIDNLTTGRRDNFPAGARGLIVGDIRNDDTVLQWDDWDVIYHCAASYRDREAWESDSSTNVLGTINVVRAAQRSRARLVYFQTALCYGPAPVSPVKLGAPLNPVGSYAVSKTAGEMYIRDSGVTFASLRLANMFGPRNLSGPVPTFYKRLSEGKPCTVVDSRRDFVYIDDLVRVATKFATSGEGVYHIASGFDTSIADLYAAVVTAMGVDAPAPTVIPRGADDAATILLDPTLTNKEFGWAVETPLQEGVASAVRWYQEHGVTETYTHLKMEEK